MSNEPIRTWLRDRLVIRTSSVREPGGFATNGGVQRSVVTGRHTMLIVETATARLGGRGSTKEQRYGDEPQKDWLTETSA